jgi:hypothetical protein
MGQPAMAASPCKCQGAGSRRGEAWRTAPMQTAAWGGMMGSQPEDPAVTITNKPTTDTPCNQQGLPASCIAQNTPQTQCYARHPNQSTLNTHLRDPALRPTLYGVWITSARQHYLAARSLVKAGTTPQGWSCNHVLLGPPERCMQSRIGCLAMTATGGGNSSPGGRLHPLARSSCWSRKCPANPWR